MTRRPIPFLAIGATLAIALAGCGSSGGGSTGSAAGSGGGLYDDSPSAAAATTASTSTANGPATIAAKKTSLGTILVDGQGRTLYLWDADTGSMSTCSGACAQAWPPVLTRGAPSAGSGVQASLLGTTKRADGTTEVTYHGHPLYTFAGDQHAGDTSGQGSDGFGAPWWVVSPAGQAVTSAA